MSKLPAGLMIQGKAVRFQSGDRGYSRWTADGKEVWDTNDQWAKFRVIHEVKFWPTREAAVEAACLAADLPQIDGRQPRIVKVSPNCFQVRAATQPLFWTKKGWSNVEHEWHAWTTARATYLAVIAAAAEIEAATPIAGWRPIETAPKDGTPALLWDECEYIGRWSPSEKKWLGAIGIVPTHWHPLPLPPSEPTNQQEHVG